MNFKNIDSMYKILVSSPCIHNNISNKNSTAIQSLIN